MKNKILSITFILTFSLFSFSSCKKKKENPAPATCPDVSDQITTSSGSSAGNDSYSIGLGSGTIRFSNLNLTFYAASTGNENVDAGDACLANLTTWPGNGTGGRITATVGHSYVSSFKTVINGVASYTYARFTVKSYQSGVITVVYVSHL